MNILADIAKNIDIKRCRAKKQIGLEEFIKDVKSELANLVNVT